MQSGLLSILAHHGFVASAVPVCCSKVLLKQLADRSDERDECDCQRSASEICVCPGHDFKVLDIKTHHFPSQRKLSHC
jgi:hypothetical protein